MQAGVVARFKMYYGHASSQAPVESLHGQIVSGIWAA